MSDLDYQLRKVEVNPIQAASGNWLDRNPENVKLSECHISLQVTMVKYVLRLKKNFVTIFSCSTALYIVDLEIVAKGFGQKCRLYTKLVLPTASAPYIPIF